MMTIFLMNVIGGIHKVVDAKRRFSAWLDNADGLFAAAAKKTAVKVEEKIPSFDIQEIPGAIRAMGMPKAAKMFDKWFEGELNYSRNSNDSSKEINQQGKPYSLSMIDKKSISLDWVLEFQRAKSVYEHLVSEHIYTVKAKQAISRILSRLPNKVEFSALKESGDDIQVLHQKFQFQFEGVEASLGQKFSQYLTREVVGFGIPDELTLILGSFNFYAAIGWAYYERDAYGTTAKVTHIYVYVRDGFTFTDDDNTLSQYLGHWNKRAVAIVPATEASIIIAKIGWLDFPIAPNSFATGVDMMYPVKNSDFRKWQLRHNQGGDFMIYTKPRSIRLRTPITVRIGEADVYVP